MSGIFAWLRQLVASATPRGGLLFAVLLGVAGVTAASLLGRLGAWFLPFDLLSHYRLQYAGLLLIAVLVAAAARSLPVAAVAGVLFVAHLVPLVPLVNQPDQPQGPGAALRVIQFNVLTNNTEIEDAAAWLVEQQPDVVVAQETDRRWTEGLAVGMDGWTLLQTDTARSDNFGMAVLVRDGVEVTAIEVFDRQSLPAIAVTIAVGSQSALLYAVHTLPPIGVDNVEVANEQLDLAADVLASHTGPQILVGDLNTSRWGASYRRIEPDLGLRNAADGFGLTGSWPSPLWFTGMIGIDHILVSDGIRVDHWEVGPDLGSDHRPVLADLTIPS
jgi:endonuclease/exonuclease/phosphatase (EEP) superfamily protein YafD